MNRVIVAREEDGGSPHTSFSGSPKVGGCRLRSSLRYKLCCPLEESQRELRPLLLLTL